jgi:cell division protein ZapA
MANVVVHVNERPYTMQCPDGEEEHLRELARLLDSEVARIRQSVGTVGDVRLLVMAGLMVADRLSEAIRRIEELEDELRGLRLSRDAAEADVLEIEAKFRARLEAATLRLEDVARVYGAS